MPKLPTVKLYRGKQPYHETMIVNATDYQRDIESFIRKGWKILSVRHGDASDDLVEFAAKQAMKEIARTKNPAHEAYHDAERRQAHNAITVSDETAKALNGDWKTLPWFSRRKYVKEKSGITPKNAAHAEEIMARYE